MIIKKVPVHLKPNQTLYLIPIGDIHFGTKECDEPRFRKLIEWCVTQKKKGDLVRLVGVGDYCEMPSPSERASFIAAKGGYGLHETTISTLDKMYEMQADEFIKIMKPVADDIVGLLSGHHYVNFSGVSDHRGLNSDEYICKRLGCTYFGTVAQFRLVFPPSKEKIDCWCHHGFGSGRSVGSKVSKRLRVLEGFRANIIMMGHDDSKFVNGLQQLVVDDEMQLRYEKVYLVGTGSFQKGYAPGVAKAGYAEEMAFGPNALGTVIFRINLEKVGNKYRVDYHPSI